MGTPPRAASPRGDCEGELTDPENKEPLKSLASAPKFNARKGFQGNPALRVAEQTSGLAEPRRGLRSRRNRSLHPEI